MTSSYRIPWRVRYRSLSKVIAYAFPIAAVVATAATFLLGYRNLAIVSVYATAPIVLVSVASAVATGRESAHEYEAPRPRAGREFRLSVALFLFLSGISALLLSTADVRQYSYYAVVAVMGVVVFGQIVRSDLSRARVGVVLLEISALLANLIWSVTFKYRYYFGRTDVFGHENSIRSLLATHHVTEAFGEYEGFPLWHILIATESMLFDGRLSTLFLAFLTSGIAFMVLIPTVYLVTRRFGFDRNVSLVAALFTCLHPFVIFSGMYSIPRSIASVLFVVLLLFLVRNDWRHWALFLGGTVAIAVYHTVTLPFIMVTLTVYYVLERYLPSEPDGDHAVRLSHLGALGGVQFGYWLVAAPNILVRVVTVLQEALLGGTGGSADGGSTGPIISMPFHELANYVPFSLLLLFVLYGVVRGPRTIRMSGRGKVILLAGLALSALSFPGPLLLLGDQLNILRFSLYTFPFIAISAAVGLLAAVRTQFRYGTDELKIGLLVGLVLTTGFVAVSNDFVASDNPLVEREFYTYYFTEAEVESFDALSASSDDMMVDYVTCRYYAAGPNGECNIMQADPETGAVHFDGQRLLLVREGELSERPIQLYATSDYVEDPAYYESLEYAARESSVWNVRSTSDRVYHSEGVSVYAAD